MQQKTDRNAVAQIVDPIVPAPIDVSRIKDEAGVKKLVRKLLDKDGWFHWMPAANGYGTGGISDFNAIKDGVFLAVETKFALRKPSALQNSYAGHIISNNGYAFLVSERNIDNLASWMANFALAAKIASHGLPVPDAIGARLLDDIHALTARWGV